VRRPVLQLATLAALFIGALMVYHRQAGSSPIVWFDTFNDEDEVQQCIIDNSCTTLGVATSVPGQVHAVGWLEWRTLLAWAGIGIGGAHLVLQIANAVAVVLIFWLAERLGGPLAGATAVWIAIVSLAGGVRFTALYNTVPLPFLGAVFVLACTAAVERPGVISLGFAALVGAVMANVHLACVLSGASVLWVALLAPRRRLFLTVFAAVLFAAATFAVAPPSWLHNLSSVLHRQTGGGFMAGRMQGVNLLNWATFAVGAWLASWFSGAPAVAEYRRRCQGSLAVLVPFLAAFIVAPHFGLDPNAKYLAHLKAACGIAAALPLALVANAVFRPSSDATFDLVLKGAAPIALASMLIVHGLLGDTADEEDVPTMADVAAVTSSLHEHHGWNLIDMLERLKAPEGNVVLTALRHVSRGSDAARALADDSETSALLMILRADELPRPLPSNWDILRRSRRSAVVLIHMQSRIDWSTFAVCVRPGNDPTQECTETGFRLAVGSSSALPGMPRSDLRSRGTLTLRLHLRSAVSNFTDEIFLPRMRNLCGGRIASSSEGALHVAADRRHATLSQGHPSPPTIDVEWDILSPECDGTAYDGLPPFFVEADAADARLLEEILRKREAS
jgi:hypothetical protein